MKKNTTLFSLGFMAISFMFVTGCGGDSGNKELPQINMDRVLQIRLHDLAIKDIEVEKVVIVVDEIQVHHTELGWMTVSDGSKKYELLELQNGISAIILQKPLELGEYTQIRLILGETNEIFVEGLPYHLKIPSGEQTGVKLICPFEIKKGKMVEVTLDFDLDRSVNLTKGQGFIMKPVIKVEEIAEYDGAGLVTSSGGNVSTLDGTLRINVPAGAVDGAIIITIEETDISGLPLPDMERINYVGIAYNVEPSGYVFNQLVHLTISYDEALVSTKGHESNLMLFRYDYVLGEWEKLPSTVLSYYDEIKTKIDHLSIYAVFVSETCSDGVQNGPEEGIDCEGDCPAVCVDCSGYNYGDASGSYYYSFGNSAVKAAAQEALDEYASYRGVDVSTLDTPDEKMEAVAYYVSAYMNWMKDEGFFDGAQTAARTVLYTGERYGCFDSDCENEGYCYEKKTIYGKPGKYCGDCEDHQILRASLLRHLGVAQQCVINADYHPSLPHPDINTGLFPWELPPEQQIVDPDGPSGQPMPYDYEKASNLFMESEAKKKGGHGFNVVIYKNKYRIMDYFYLGYYFNSSNEWSQTYHQADNVWNDHFGRHWNWPFTPPPTKIHNYPGPNKCYEEGKSYWTHDTLYADICP